MGKVPNLCSFTNLNISIISIDIIRIALFIIPSDVIGGGCLDDYMEHLTFTPNEFIDSNGELLSVSDLSEII